MQRASQLLCRQNRQSKSKQIETNTGSSCKCSQGLPVLCMERISSLEQAKKSLQPRHQGQAAGNSGCRGQADCRADRICKVNPNRLKQIRAVSASIRRGCLFSVWKACYLWSRRKSRCNQDTKDKQPEILDAEGKPIAVQAESAR